MDFGVRDGHNQHHKRSNTPQLLYRDWDGFVQH